MQIFKGRSQVAIEDRHITIGSGDVEFVVTESTKTVLLYVRTPPPAADGDTAKMLAAQEFDKALEDMKKDLRTKGYFFAVFTGNG